MRKLHLHIDKMIKGQFNPKKINLLLLFQVNCPGCFSYSLPLFNKLYHQFNKDLGFIALSTAFEDFKLNTLKNTVALANEGELIGETKKFLSDQGHERIDNKYLFYKS